MPDSQIPTPFKLERYFAKYEFNVKYLLSPSDCEGLHMQDLLGMARPEARRLWDELKLNYTESQGHPMLRAEIASLYQGINPDQVITAAPEEAIFIAMHTLLKPGDHMVSLFPAYQSLYELARSLGCAVSYWPFHLGEQGWRLDLDELEDLLRPETRLLVINFPHNPTGFLPSSEFLDEVLALARKRDLYLFSDEMYRWLEYDPSARLPAVCEQYEQGISLSGLSKSFALPGLRVGWLAAQDPSLMQAWLSYKDYTTICSSAPSEILAIMALQAREQVLSRSLEIVSSNLQTAGAFFNQLPHHFRWIPPQGGSIAFPEWKGPGSVEQFCQALLDQRQVMALPGSIFDFPGNFFRIGLGRKDLPQVLEQVEAVLPEIDPKGFKNL